MRILRFTAILAVVVGALAGVVPTARAELRPTYTVVGRVTDALDRPVANEWVTVDNFASARTDANGDYSIPCNCYSDSHTVSLRRMDGYKITSFTKPGVQRVDFPRARFKLWVYPTTSNAPRIVTELPGSVPLSASTGMGTDGTCVSATDSASGEVVDYAIESVGTDWARYNATVHVPVGATGAPHILDVRGYDCVSGAQLTWDIVSQTRTHYLVDLAAPELTVVAPAPIRSNAVGVSVKNGGAALLRTAAHVTDDARLKTVEFSLKPSAGAAQTCTDAVYDTSSYAWCDWYATPGRYTLTTTVYDTAGRSTTDVVEFSAGA